MKEISGVLRLSAAIPSGGTHTCCEGPAGDRRNVLGALVAMDKGVHRLFLPR